MSGAEVTTKNSATNLLSGASMVAAAAMAINAAAADTNLPPVDRAAFAHPPGTVMSTNPVSDMRAIIKTHSNKTGGSINVHVGDADVTLNLGESTVLFNGTNWVLAAVTPSTAGGKLTSCLGIVGPTLKDELRLSSTGDELLMRDLHFISPTNDPKTVSYSFAAVPGKEGGVVLVTPSGEQVNIPKAGAALTFDGIKVHFMPAERERPAGSSTMHELLLQFAPEKGKVLGDTEVQLGGSETKLGPNQHRHNPPYITTPASARPDVVNAGGATFARSFSITFDADSLKK